MRLSDAIAMGRCTVSELKGGTLSGCALGMAANAVGLERDYDVIAAHWPWIAQLGDNCLFCGMKLEGVEHGLVLAHVFDSHVFHRSRHPFMNLDEMIDWVRSIEPPEPSESAAPEILTLAEELASIT